MQLIQVQNLVFLKNPVTSKAEINELENLLFLHAQKLLVKRGNALEITSVLELYSLLAIAAESQSADSR
ncbi:hypothetical protein VNO78_02995 [Psophocarpus tetragonolobus]|uniref:Uncharacterized protein n=1 Tax=Psophocarpus tetragonolobus TaxID=3891 RepID=A0AAN9TD33_PSOTE